MASIKKRPNGKWRARYRDEAGKEHARHFDRKTDAQRWLDEVTASVVTGHYVDPRAGRVTFESYAQAWAERQVWVRSTEAGFRLAVGSTTFGALEMHKIRPSHIEAWIKRMRDGNPSEQEPRKLAATTITTRFNIVHGVFTAAIRDRVIASDPCTGVTLPRRRRREAAMTIPTADQVGALLDAAREDFTPFVALAAFAGLRLGEVCALQLGDVDFLRRTVHVRRQVQRAPGGEAEIRPPKFGSERDVFLPDELVTMLSVHVSGLNDGDPGRWLFERAPDKPHHQNSAGFLWRGARESARVEARFHDLRHFFASGLIAAGCDVVTVQRALGHTSATTTLSVYAHLWPSAEDRTRQAAAALMSEAMRPVADAVRTAEGGDAHKSRSGA